MRGGQPDAETYNPWTVVHVVFAHLADQGLHPVLGEAGDPAVPARALLDALGIQPSAEGNGAVRRRVHAHLAEIRGAVFGDDPAPGPPAPGPPAPGPAEDGGLSRTETPITPAARSNEADARASRGEWT